MAYSFELDTDDWDLQLNTNGQFLMCDGDYAIAQNVANKVRLFTNDAYFYPEDGIPHFNIELGIRPALSVFRARVREAAESVEGVESAEVADLQVTQADRQLTGDIELTLESGTVYTLAQAF